MLTPIKIAISSCLRGNKVRYDGGQIHDRFLTQTLDLVAEYVPVCPDNDLPVVLNRIKTLVIPMRNKGSDLGEFTQ